MKRSLKFTGATDGLEYLQQISHLDVESTEDPHLASNLANLVNLVMLSKTNVLYFLMQGLNNTPAWTDTDLASISTLTNLQTLYMNNCVAVSYFFCGSDLLVDELITCTIFYKARVRARDAIH